MCDVIDPLVADCIVGDDVPMTACCEVRTVLFIDSVDIDCDVIAASIVSCEVIAGSVAGCDVAA